MIRIPALKMGSKGRADKSSLFSASSGSAPSAGIMSARGASLQSDLEVPMEIIFDGVMDVDVSELV